jgi:hypothetical protein
MRLPSHNAALQQEGHELVLQEPCQEMQAQHFMRQPILAHLSSGPTHLLDSFQQLRTLIATRCLALLLHPLLWIPRLLLL